MLKKFEVIEIYSRKHIRIKKSLATIYVKVLLAGLFGLLSSNYANAQIGIEDMDIDQKISQLFVYEIDRGDFEEDFKRLSKTSDDGLGMIILDGDLSGKEIQQLENFISGLSPRPLIIYKSSLQGRNWPTGLSIGAVQDDDLISEWAEAAGKELYSSGIEFCFSHFPGISRAGDDFESRKFSVNEDWEIVSRKTGKLLDGFNKSGIRTIVPDFPGFRNHREGQAYSVNFDEERIKSIEMMPYRQAIKSGADIIQMSASMFRDASEEYKPFFLSESWTRKTLRKDLKFQGLVMSGDIDEVSEWYNSRNGEIEQMAFEAGNDLLLNPENANAAKRRIRSLVRKNRKLEEALDQAVKRILEYKKRTGAEMALRSFHGAELEYDKLLRNSITVIDDSELLPVEHLGLKRIACVHLGIEHPNVISTYIDKYDRIKHFYLRDRFNYYEKFTELIAKLRDFDVVILPIGNVPFDALENFGIGNQIPRFAADLSEQKEVMVLALGNPAFIDVFPNRVAKIISYDTGSVAERIMPQILFGAKESKGKLPFATEKYAWNSGKQTKGLKRLDYVYPEEVGMDPSILSKIDDVVKEALISQATPGCQVLVAKDGHIVLEKSYGYLSYDSVNPVSNETVYDIASITKVAATLQAVMLLSEMGVIDLNTTASRYLYDLRASNKDELFISDILAHQAGLTPYIPYWKQTVGNEGLDDRYYCDNPDDWFCVEVVPGIYTIRSMEDSLWKWTLESDLREKKKDGTFDYKYSDLGFYIMKKLVERKTRQPIEDFLEQNFYAPLGMSKLTFFPLAYFSPDEIAPTEQDDYFRNTLVRGTVHDQGAAMFGGVGGHAGLFSNANDLAKIMQMHLNKGFYGGERFFRPQTIETFTDRHFRNNRRGLGWDKPLRSGNGPTSDLCSYNTFGHTGFTGTAMWADPEYDLVYVFLSNRIHPDANNRKLIEQNIRTRIQDIIYESIFIKDIDKKK